MCRNGNWKDRRLSKSCIYLEYSTRYRLPAGQLRLGHKRMIDASIRCVDADNWITMAVRRTMPVCTVQCVQRNHFLWLFSGTRPYPNQEDWPLFFGLYICKLFDLSFYNANDAGLDLNLQITYSMFSINLTNFYWNLTNCDWICFVLFFRYRGLFCSFSQVPCCQWCGSRKWCR